MGLLFCCYVADLFFGDPEWSPHPVRGMGSLISFLDGRLRADDGKWGERMKGMLSAFIAIGISVCLAYFVIVFSRKLNPVLGGLTWVYLGYTTLSIKDLRVKACKIREETEKGQVVEARRHLSKIVSRDTGNLNEDRIIVATIESVAENTSDGIIAPLFYLILGGPVLAIAYKCINTLDSMVGYKNEKYRHFGWFSAKLDDIVNFVPARISGFLISVSSLFTGKGFRGPFKTMIRDGRNHASPNSGVSEAAMAGALGVKLGGAWSYHGRLSTKPCIGEKVRLLQPFLIDEALTISLVASVLMVLIGVIIKWLI